MSISDLKHLFGAAVRVQRSHKGISQEELADRAGLHRTYISDIERGARNLSLKSIEKLAHALEVSVSSLFVHAGNGSGPSTYVEILLIEDDAHDAEMTQRAFRRARITNVLNVVTDGAEALAFLQAAGTESGPRAHPLPGVILLDLNLPKIDGIEVLRRIKASKRTQHIPVVVLTASNNGKDVEECRRLGAESYILKPVDFINFSEITPRLQLDWALRKPTGEEGAGTGGNEPKTF